jgi:hypothetical protein
MTAPAGFVTKPLELIRQIVARSATFQALTGSADAAAALEHVHLFSYPIAATGWLAMVDWGNALAAQRTAVENGRPWDSSGSHLLYFQNQPAATDEDEEAVIVHANNVGAILDEMRDFSGVTIDGDRLIVTSYDLVSINMPDPKDRDLRLVVESWWQVGFRRVVR